VKRENDDWNDSKRIASGILRDRSVRRRWLGAFLLASLSMIAAGVWVIDACLALGALVFLLWWGACSLLTFFTLLFAVYDALAVAKEEKAGAKGESGCCDRPEV
jgi:polyferredoxin